MVDEFKLAQFFYPKNESQCGSVLRHFAGIWQRRDGNKHIRGSGECCLLGENTTCEFFGEVIPFIKLQNNTLKQQLNGEKIMKNEMES